MSKKGNSSIIAIVAMIFLFGMISFVTNLAAPIGNIWKMQPGIETSGRCSPVSKAPTSGA